MPGASARFVDHLLRFVIGFRQDLGMTLLGFRQLLLDLFGVQLCLRDLLPPLFQHGKDRFVGEAFEQISDDDEADDLRKEQLRIPSEGVGCIAQCVHRAAAGGCEE